MSREQEAEKQLHDQENILPKSQLLFVFSILALVLLICFIDQNGVSVALPTLAKDLNAEATISWTGTASLIANTVFSVLYGRFSDIFGRKTIFIAACGLLALADLLCGLAQNSTMLYVFRAFAGLAGGGITNLAMIIVSDVVTLENRGKYQGILGSCVGIGNVAGPFIMAGFIERSTWRGFFYLLAPSAALCGLVALFFLPSKSSTSGFMTKFKQIDHWGSLTSTVAIIFILIPISGGGSYFSWTSPMVLAMLSIGFLCLIAFVIIEWKVAVLPMMPVSFFTDRAIVALLIQSFLLGWVYQSYLYYLPLYYQNVRGYGVIVSAALIVPLNVMQAFAGIASGRYISWKKRYSEVIWFGFGMWLLGSGLMILFDQNTHPVVCIVILCLVGIGVGNVFQPTLVALQASCRKAQRAVITGDRNFFRCCGGACGLAVSAAVLQAGLKANLPPGYKYLASSTYMAPHVSASDEDAVVTAYMKASRNVFILQVPLMGICFACCLLVRDRGIERREAKQIEKVEQSENGTNTNGVRVPVIIEEQHDSKVAEKLKEDNK